MASTSPTASTEWDVAVATGLIRLGAGVVLWRWRDALIPRVGGSVDDPWVRGLFRYFAVRDMAVGIKTLLATRPGSDVPRVVTLQGVADTADTAVLATYVATDRLRRGPGIGAVGLAAGTAVLEYAAAWQLRRRRLPRS